LILDHEYPGSYLEERIRLEVKQAEPQPYKRKVPETKDKLLLKAGEMKCQLFNTQM